MGRPFFAAPAADIRHAGAGRADLHSAADRAVAEDIGLLINEDDPLSRATGAHYQKVRRIPDGNVIRLHFTPGQSAISPDRFAALKQQIDAETPRHVQAFAVAVDDAVPGRLHVADLGAGIRLR